LEEKIHKIRTEFIDGISDSKRTQSELSLTINEFIRFMIEERNEKNEFFNKKLNIIEE
jgi:hypothetical protein